MWRMLERMAKGDATKDEVDMLGDVTNQIAGHTICAFGEGSSSEFKENLWSMLELMMVTY